MGWTFLSGAIVAEVTATPALRASDGLSRPRSSSATAWRSFFWPGRSRALVRVPPMPTGPGSGRLGRLSEDVCWLKGTAVFGMVLVVTGVAVTNLGGGVSHG